MSHKETKNGDVSGVELPMNIVFFGLGAVGSSLLVCLAELVDRDGVPIRVFWSIRLIRQGHGILCIMQSIFLIASILSVLTVLIRFLVWRLPMEGNSTERPSWLMPLCLRLTVPLLSLRSGLAPKRWILPRICTIGRQRNH